MAKKALTAASLAKLGSKSDQTKALVVLRKGNAIDQYERYALTEAGLSR